MLDPRKRRPLPGGVKVSSAIHQYWNEMVVWWYDGLKKNEMANSHPMVNVWFVGIDRDGSLMTGMDGLPGGFQYKEVPITHLGMMRIGTIWKNEECRWQIPQAMEDFPVDFTDGRFQFVSRANSRSENKPLPFPNSHYRLMGMDDGAWLLEFPLDGGRRLLVPCLEFFSRCYGLPTQKFSPVNIQFFPVSRANQVSITHIQLWGGNLFRHQGHGCVCAGKKGRRRHVLGEKFHQGRHKV